MKKIIVGCLTIICFLPSAVFAQEEMIPIETQLAEILGDLNDLQGTLKHQKAIQSRSTAKKLKLIGKKIDRAVKTIPPSNCLKRLKVAMDDFYGLTSDLGTGISCGPSILPPFLERKEPEPLTTNCLPPEDELLAQIGSPFSEVYGLYNQARDLFHIDVNTNEIPDSCE